MIVTSGYDYYQKGKGFRLPYQLIIKRVQYMLNPQLNGF